MTLKSYLYKKNNIMLEIKKTYVTDSKKHPFAVQIDIQTFGKIEQLLEDYALGQFIEENDPNELLSLSEAREFYQSIDHKNT